MEKVRTKLVAKALHVNGVQVAGSQATKIADASTAHALNSTFSDTEVEAALNALGTKINAIIDALEGFGVSASS
jgi:hypothetical protein